MIRKTADTITDDDLDALYGRLERAETIITRVTGALMNMSQSYRNSVVGAVLAALNSEQAPSGPLEAAQGASTPESGAREGRGARTGSQGPSGASYL